MDDDDDNNDDDGDDDGWLEAAGGRDDVNPGVDRLRCSAPCGHLVHSRTQCTTNRPPSAVLLRLTAVQCTLCFNYRALCNLHTTPSTERITLVSSQSSAVYCRDTRFPCIVGEVREEEEKEEDKGLANILVVMVCSVKVIIIFIMFI